MDRAGIEEWLKKYKVENYTINEDLSVDVPVKFRNVSGYFSCRNNNLQNLIGCPDMVGGAFDCSYNQLTSLIGCPIEIGGSFNGNANKLVSLVGGPSVVGDNYIVVIMD